MLVVQRTLAAVGDVHRVDVGRGRARVGEDTANSVRGQLTQRAVKDLSKRRHERPDNEHITHLAGTSLP